MKDKAAEIFGLHKVPDKAYIKELRVELGKQSAYIEELEEKIAFLTTVLNNPQELRKIRECKLYAEQQLELNKLRAELAKQKKDYSILLTKHLEKNQY